MTPTTQNQTATTHLHDEMCEACHDAQDMQVHMRATLEMVERAFNVPDVDPLIAFATMEKVRALLARAR